MKLIITYVAVKEVIQMLGILNVKNALKHVSKQPMLQILIQPETVIYFVITASLSLTSTVWSWPKAPSAPAVEQTSLEANTINGA